MKGLKKTSTVRLNKYLALAGLGSRRSMERVIAAGEVRVNGACIQNPSHQINFAEDEVVVKGNPVKAFYLPTYLILNKPAGYITTAKDEKGRETIFKFVKIPVRVFPVGRLDKNSEGLLLLTNDGQLAKRLMHPRYQVKKEYFVLLNKNMDRKQELKFRKGIVIDKQYEVCGEIAFANAKNRKACLVTISEGKNRQIRKMFAAIGLRVQSLQRISIGPLKLGRLSPGSWRYLTPKEILALKETVRLTHGNCE